MPESSESRIVAAIQRGRFRDPMSRRSFLAVASAAGLTAGLAACSSSSSTATGTVAGAGRLARPAARSSAAPRRWT